MLTTSSCMPGIQPLHTVGGCVTSVIVIPGEWNTVRKHTAVKTYYLGPSSVSEAIDVAEPSCVLACMTPSRLPADLRLMATWTWAWFLASG